jgi:hypothetical protein
MAFNVTNTFTAGSDADSDDINQNFADIETELNAFPSSGAVKDGAITNAMIQTGVITTAKLSQTETTLSTSTSILPVSNAVKEYVDARVFSSFYGVYKSTTTQGLGDSYAKYNMTTKVSGESDRITDGRYVVNATGTFIVAYYCRMHANAHGNVRAQLYFPEQGTPARAASYSDGNSSLTQDVVIGNAVEIAMTSGDTVEVQVSATSGRGGSVYNSYLYVTKVA